MFYEGCYGTNRFVDPVQFVSKCPQQGIGGDGDGDSPPGLPGSAAPVPNCVIAPKLTRCHHGTLVAGIAAGRFSTDPLMPVALPPRLFQGVAPDARIAAIQIFSYDQARIKPPVAFKIDLYAALQFLISVTTPGTVNNPFVINMSLGGVVWPVECTNESKLIAPLIKELFDRGVPVIAATGNDGTTNGTAWPSCLPTVIKVSSVENDGIGNTRASYANMPRISSFPGERVWLAPGGGGATFVKSSIPESASYITATDDVFGTSFAAPHVAGLYAVLKAALPGSTVDYISQAIHNNASVDVPVNLCLPESPCPTVFKRVRWP